MVEKKGKRNKRHKTIALAVLLTAIIIFISLYVFFGNHFYLGTEINGVSVSGMTATDADKELEAFASAYTLELNGRGDIKEKITGSEIGLSMPGDIGSAALKQEQNKTSWLVSLFDHKALKLGTGFLVDENMMQEAYNKLSCVDATRLQNLKMQKSYTARMAMK